MMLGTLLRGVCVQGNVTLTLFKNGEEVAMEYIRETDNLKYEAGLGLWKRMDIAYMFTSPDGSLHIDFEMDED